MFVFSNVIKPQGLEPLQFPTKFRSHSVVDTTNFTDKTGFHGSSVALSVVERFTRVDADTILYEFTVTDPTTWRTPWSVEIPMMKTDGPLYEYTCHEGNYGIVNTLSGARALERQAAEEAEKIESR